jgi:hypothetical protein
MSRVWQTDLFILSSYEAALALAPGCWRSRGIGASSNAFWKVPEFQMSGVLWRYIVAQQVDTGKGVHQSYVLPRSLHHFFVTTVRLTIWLLED